MLRGFLIAIAATLAAVPGVMVTGAGSPAAAQTPFRPVAVVNDSAITGYDLAQRAQLMVALGYPTENVDALRAQALDQLVQDRLKLEAGRDIGILPSDEAYAEGLAAFAQQAGMTPEAFIARMADSGVTESALRDLIQAEMVWRSVIRARFGSRVDVAEGEIDAEIELLGQGTTSSFRLQEIGLPFTDGGRNEAQTRALANRLYSELSAGGDFEAAARRYSRSPSASNGGDVGWVSRRQMPDELFTALQGLGVGDLTPPLPVPGGVTILKIVEMRTEASGGLDPSDPELRDQIRNRIAAQRSARLAEGFLQELRRDALIEVR